MSFGLKKTLSLLHSITVLKDGIKFIVVFGNIYKTIAIKLICTFRIAVVEEKPMSCISPKLLCPQRF